MNDPWIHRSDNMKCKTCMWFVIKQVQKAEVGAPSYDMGRCRRHAPAMGGYPVVFVNDWCGDHRLDENKFYRETLSSNKSQYAGMEHVKKQTDNIPMPQREL